MRELTCQRDTIEAYVESNEGIDRAGGFAIQVSLRDNQDKYHMLITQGLGGLLIEGIEGNYDNCVGFPSAPFWKWMSELSEEGLFADAWN